MASEGFYVLMGIFGFIILVFGFMGMYGEYPAPWTPVSGYILLVGFVFFGIIGIGAYRDIKSRVRDWNAEHKSDELEQREAELELKEKEMEIKTRESQLRKEYEEQKKNEKPTLPKDIKDDETIPEIKLDDKYSQESFNDVPISWTGKSTSDLAQSNHEETSGLSDEDYRQLIDDSLYLKALWTIYKEPNKYRNPSDLYKGFREDLNKANRKSKMYEVMKADEFEKLIENLNDKDQLDGYILSSLGIQLIEKAKQEKIVTWRKFIEIFSEEIETGIVTDTVHQSLSSKEQEIQKLYEEFNQYLYDKNHEKVIEIMDKILSIDPERVNALSNKAYALDRLGYSEEAERYIDRALAVDPDYAYALGLKAGLNIVKNPKVAIELWQKSLLFEIDPHAYSGISAAYANLGRFVDALDYVNKALEYLTEDDPTGKRKHALALKAEIEKDLKKQKDLS